MAISNPGRLRRSEPEEEKKSDDDIIADNLRSRKIIDRDSDSNRARARARARGAKKARLSLQNKENENPKGWFPPGDHLDPNFWKKLCIPSVLKQLPYAVVSLAGDVDEESSALNSWLADELKRKQGKVAGDKETWNYWANGALEYYNRNFVPRSQKERCFRLLEVTSVLTDLSTVHMNFKAIEANNDGDDDASSKLFFAELNVRNWFVPDNVPDNFILIGCCILQQIDSDAGDLDTRLCSMCGEADVMHPIPRYGYRSAGAVAFDREEW